MNVRVEKLKYGEKLNPYVPLILFHCCSFFLLLGHHLHHAPPPHPTLIPAFCHPPFPPTTPYYSAMVVQSLGLFYQVHTVRIERLRLELLLQEQRGRQVDNQNCCYPNPKNYHQQQLCPQPYPLLTTLRCPLQNGLQCCIVSAFLAMSPTKLVILLIVDEIGSPWCTITKNTKDHHIWGGLAQFHQSNLTLLYQIKINNHSDFTCCPEVNPF